MPEVNLSDVSSDEDFQRVADTIAKYWRDERDEDFWGVETYHDVSGRPERTEVLRRLILALADKVEPHDEKVLVMIGTGPLEDYIRCSGVLAIEKLAASAVEYPALVDAARFTGSSDPVVQSRLTEFLAAHGTSTDED